MFTAKEAQEIVTQVKLKTLSGIEKEIKERAEKGLTCIWRDYIEDCVIDELKNAGYKVNYFSDTDEYKVSWESPNGYQSKNY